MPDDEEEEEEDDDEDDETTPSLMGSTTDQATRQARGGRDLKVGPENQLPYDDEDYRSYRSQVPSYLDPAFMPS